MTVFRFRLALAGALLAGAMPAFAAVLALAPTTRGDGLHVVDVVTHNSTVLEAGVCCAVQAGSVAADTVNHRVFFLANHAGGTADLYTFGYAAAATVSSVPIGGAARVSHLAYDAAHARLVGLTARDDQGVDVVTIAPATGNVVVMGSLGPACCTLRAGVSAYQSASGILYAVGRRSSDTSDQLLAFSVNAGTLQNAWDLGTEQIAQLVAEGSTLYALSSVRNTTTLRAGTFALTPAFQFNAIGTGADDCCFVLAGSATIDHANNMLVALTRASGTSGAFSIRRFSLSSGNASTGSMLQAMGLFEDTAVLFDRIFADGFQ